MSGLPLHLERDAIHLPATRGAVALPAFGGEYERYIAAHCTAADPGRLVAIAESKESWPVWEVHPAGEEIVIVVSGRAEFLQDVGGTIERVIVGPNEAIINPAGVPHTANVIEPFTAVYITPCPETHHLPRKPEHG
jgi:mannose-6-phosphate isomerase-like protein (cupin superfamily)